MTPETEPRDWQARARREAAAIVAEIPGLGDDAERYGTLISLVAIGWMQGVSYGSHLTLAESEAAFERLRAAL